MEEEVSITRTRSMEAASPMDEAEMVVELKPIIRINPKFTRRDAVTRTSLRAGSVHSSGSVGERYASCQYEHW